MNLRPLSDNLIILRDETETVSKGGLHLLNQDKAMTGTVIAAGKGVYDNTGKFIENSVKKGDKVMFHNKAGSEAEIENTTYVIMKELEIIGIIR